MEILLLGFIVILPILAIVADKFITPFLPKDNCKYCDYELENCVCLKGTKNV